MLAMERLLNRSLPADACSGSVASVTLGDMLNVRVFVEPSASLAGLKSLAEWAEKIELAYAWVSSSGGSADHWKVLPLERVRRAIVGIHFAQTEPHVLRELHELGVLRVIGDTGGVFHPKLIVGVKGNEARAIVGSSNLTGGGFGGNTEVNLLLTGSTHDEVMEGILRFMSDQWAHPRAFEPTSDWFEEYEKLYDARPKPPKVGASKKRTPAIIRDGDDLDLDWAEFVEVISKQERRALWIGWEIRVFDHSDGSYLQEVEGCQAAFAVEPTYKKMPVEDRKLVAGWGSRTAGYYGRMQGAGYFKNVTREHPEEVSKHLDKIALSGPVSAIEARTFLNGIMGVRGVALGTATRLLCMKRPDLFLPANNASLVNIRKVFGSAPNTVDKYIALVEWIWQFPWFSAPKPRDVNGTRIWRARVALLDAIFYDPPDYLK